MLSQLKQATERPRRIERLRGEVLHLEDRLKRVKEAQRVATEAVDKSPSEATRSELNLVRRAWQKKQVEVEQELQFTRLERDLAYSERSSVSGLGRSLFNLLFRSRGKNLAFAVLVFLCMLVAVRLTHQVVLKLSTRVPRESVGMRLVELSIYGVGGLVAMLSMLGVLFASGDWVLLTMAALLFFGVVYSLRTGIPRFWSEIQLLLNIGAVREGERLVWQGVPWRVEKLAMLTVLTNPAFPDTRVRVPLSGLHGTSSRPSTEGERWFPSELGDWVVWADRAAHVLSQGPEFVTLHWDRSDISVPTPEFLGSSPINLSHGFRHRVVVTLDYRHQAIVTDEVPTRLREHVAAALLREGVEAELEGLTVAFEAASASSLDVEIEVDFAGSAAGDWEHLEELIQAAAVDACNAEGWEIALPQLTVHQAG